MFRQTLAQGGLGGADQPVISAEQDDNEHRRGDERQAEPAVGWMDFGMRHRVGDGLP